MKVHQLIEILKTKNPDAAVYLMDEFGAYLQLDKVVHIATEGKDIEDADLVLAEDY